MSIAMLTANIGDYDISNDHFFMDNNIDYFYFTDGDKAPKGQTLVKVNTEDFPENTPGVQIARLIKANPFKYLLGSNFNYEYIIWVDACFEQKKSVLPLFSILGSGNILTMQHPNRNCIYSEMVAVKEFKLADENVLKEHHKMLLNSGYPNGNGLAATGIMIRRNCEEVHRLCELWEKLLSGNLYRDQLFFDYACWVLKIPYKKFGFSERNAFFYNHLHKKTRISYEYKSKQ